MSYKFDPESKPKRIRLLSDIAKDEELEKAIKDGNEAKPKRVSLKEPELGSSTMYRQTVIRNGERMVLVKTRKEGYRIEYDAKGVPHEVRIKPKEQLARELGQVTAQEQRDARMGEIQRKRKESIAKKEMFKASGKFDPEER